MKKNKILAGLSALVMGATMMAGTAMSASAATVYDSSNSAVGDCYFYRYKNNAWSPAPYGMDDGNIKNAVYNSNGTITVYFDFATYYVMGFLPVTGGVADVSGSGVVAKGGDEDEDGCLDWATFTPDGEFSLTICDSNGNTNIAFGLMPNPIETKLVYILNS